MLEGPQGTPLTIEELCLGDAFNYLKARLAPAEMPRRSFDLYVLHGVVPSRTVEGVEVATRADLDEFAKHHPSGSLRAVQDDESDVVSMRDAFKLYSEKDPRPLSFAAFRELAHVGVVRAVFTSPLQDAPIVGVHQNSVFEFLARRHRQAERAEEREKAVALAHKMEMLLQGTKREGSPR